MHLDSGQPKAGLPKSEQPKAFHLTAPVPTKTFLSALSECPRCGSVEWDRVDAERGRERDVPFNRCTHCDSEWEAA
jgi:hypothetical protein